MFGRIHRAQSGHPARACLYHIGVVEQCCQMVQYYTYFTALLLSNSVARWCNTTHLWPIFYKNGEILHAFMQEKIRAAPSKLGVITLF